MSRSAVPPARLTSTGHSLKDVARVSNLMISNIFLFFAILCLAISAELAWPLYFVYSTVATGLAGAVRYHQLPEEPRLFRRRHH
jgi:hypothetical protein